MMPLIRLQKFLSDAGFCSRRKGEEYIRKGHVKINGTIVTELGIKVDPEKDQVEVDNTPVSQVTKKIYIALNKPKGYITSCHQPDEKIVLDLVKIPDRVYPIGRLDKDSTGLLLLTNDGKLHHQLSHPSFDHEKEYEVKLARPIPDGALKHMAKGLPMMGTKTRPARIERKTSRLFYMTLKEGKNRQIRRMVRKVGNRITHLKRIRIANIHLGNLPEGKWRYLAENEVYTLLKNI